jgi:hypothetical protein
LFFFEKKNQKTFVPLRALPASPRQPFKSLLRLFFRKEDSSSSTYIRPMPRINRRFAHARTLAGLLATCVLYCWASAALALEPCFAGSVGSWRGPVLNNTGLEQMDTNFQITPAGALSGTYFIHDVLPFEGRLDGFRIRAPCEADFTWHDRYGSGVVHIRFDPAHGRFIGRYGLMAPNPQAVFEGYRAVSPPSV